MTQRGEWRGRDDDRRDRPVPFGRKARAWLRLRIRRELFTSEPDDPGTWKGLHKSNWERYTKAAVDELLEWYLDRPLQFVVWEGYDEWYGRGFVEGRWVFDSTAVIQDFATAERETGRAHDTRAHTTLDDWLRADIPDKLYYAGDPGGMARLTGDALAVVEHRRLNRRQCRCGKSFQADRRNAKRCPACRELARSQTRVPRRSA